MGRGRAKAKQTKVARRLKYSSPNTDLDALRAELSGDTSSEGADATAEQENGSDEYASDKYSEEYDPYAEYRDDK